MIYLRISRATTMQDQRRRNPQGVFFIVGLLVALWDAPLLPAQTSQLAELEQAALQKAAAQANDFVVQIETFGGMERVGEEIIADGPTTGTILTDDGWIISSLHNFRQQPDSILVNLPAGKRSPARIVARDFSRELVLLKVEVSDGERLPGLSQEQPAKDQSVAITQELVGKWVVALGKTYSPEQASRSIGIVSAVGRAYDRAIQTDAKISPINYGGPLVDLEGRVIGILAPLSPGEFFEGDSSQIYDSGIGFAIPMADIWQRLPRMQLGKDIYPGKLGLVASNQNELAGPVRVAGAVPGSPAGKAGMRAGDVVIEAGGKTVNLLADLRHALGPVDAGQSLVITVWRDGQRRSLDCDLTAEIPIYQRRYLGLWLRESKADEGLVIEALDPNSPAVESDLREGQRLVSCNGQPIESAEDLRQSIAVAELDVPLNLGVVADGNRIQVPILAVRWPDDLAEIPDTDDASQTVDEPQAEIVELALGDVPNKGFAVVPAKIPADRSLGLLIVYPEPGSMDREETLTRWQSFSGRHGWIVAIINSANEKQWSLDELELAGRVLGRLQSTYSVDPARTVVAGLGIGGRLAFISGSMLRDKINGVMAIGTDFPRFQVRRENFPLQSLDYLFVGDESQWQEPSKLLTQRGYSVIGIPVNISEPQNWESHPQEPIERWLQGLARF